MPHILFLNRSYWPDAEATGQLLTELCEDLADEFEITVIAGQPNTNSEQAEFQRRGRQIRNGVNIHRVRHTQFNKSRLLGRLANYCSFMWMATFASLTMRRPDVVVVETDPPLLCLLGALLRWRFRCRLIVYLQDIYPDVAVALGKLPAGFLTRSLRTLFFHVYKTADRVVVLSEDMRELLVESSVPPQSIATLANWADTRRLLPIKSDNAFRRRHGLEDQFVVMYSGNLGLTQPLGQVLLAAEALQDRKDLTFLLIGNGASRRELEAKARERELANVRFLDYQPKSELSQSLSAADLHLVPLDRRVVRHLMPSKIYGILASGSPMLVMAPENCELARLTRAHDVGFVVPPDDTTQLVERINWCVDHWQTLLGMGQRARYLAESQYDRRIATTAFAQELCQLTACGKGGSGKGVRSQLCEAPSGPSRQLTPDPFSTCEAPSGPSRQLTPDPFSTP